MINVLNWKKKIKFNKLKEFHYFLIKSSVFQYFFTLLIEIKIFLQTLLKKSKILFKLKIYH